MEMQFSNYHIKYRQSNKQVVQQPLFQEPMVQQKSVILAHLDGNEDRKSVIKSGVKSGISLRIMVRDLYERFKVADAIDILLLQLIFFIIVTIIFLEIVDSASQNRVVGEFTQQNSKIVNRDLRNAVIASQVKSPENQTSNIYRYIAGEDYLDRNAPENTNQIANNPPSIEQIPSRGAGVQAPRTNQQAAITPPTNNSSVAKAVTAPTKNVAQNSATRTPNQAAANSNGSRPNTPQNSRSSANSAPNPQQIPPQQSPPQVAAPQSQPQTQAEVNNIGSNISATNLTNLTDMLAGESSWDQSASSSIYMVQVGLYSSSNSAHRDWKTLYTENSHILSPTAYNIERIERADRTMFVLKVGPFNSRGKASAFCSRLVNSGRDCFFVNN